MPSAKKRTIRRQFGRCPNCRYHNGFHVMFTRKKERGNAARVQLICPSCSSVYDIGLRVELDKGT